MDRKVSAVFNLIMSLVLVGLALLAAGTLNWPRFWFFLGFYVAATSGAIPFLFVRSRIQLCV